MNGNQYKLSILPLFEDDLDEIVDYITFRLRNPNTAEICETCCNNKRALELKSGARFIFAFYAMKKLEKRLIRK